MEPTHKQANRIYLTPDERAENARKASYNWYTNHKEYFKQGGRGYEAIMRRTTCTCGREVFLYKMKAHEATKLHMKRLQATE